MSNFFYRWDDVQRLKNIQPGEKVWPHFLDWHVTATCNQQCAGCYYHHHHVLNNEPKEWLPESKAFNVIDQFLDVGVKGFDFAGGGEPTVAPYLPDIIEHIGARGGTCGLITNGTLLKGRVLDAMLKHGTYVRVSMEASNRDTYRLYKGVDHWNTVVDNIREAIALRDKSGSQLEISIKYAVGKRTKGKQHYVDGIRLGQELGVGRITFKALRMVDDELELEDKKAEDKLLRTVLIESEATNVHHWIVPWKAQDISQCWLNQLHTMMDHNAELFICCFYLERRDTHSIGNILETPLKDLWMCEDHRKKVAAISKHSCEHYDCKLFSHHKNLREAERGMMHFL